ncbi:TPA: DUF6236 family protein [Klebsiella variicola subsp. variicola]
MKHGMILTRKMTLENGSISVNGGFDPSALRLAVLYLDGICVPQSQLVGFGLTEEMKTLKSEGYLSEKYYPIRQSQAAGSDILVTAYGDCFEELNKTNNEVWMVHNSLNAHLTKIKTTDDGGECIQLLNALPMPGEDFPLGDLLEFKSKRKDNLKELLLSIEEFRLEIINAENQDMEIKKSIIKIEKNIIDLHKLIKETQPGWYLSSFSLDISSNDLLDVFTKIYGEAKELGMEELNALLTSAGLSVATCFNIKGGYRFKAGKPNSPYLYAAEVKQKFRIN